LVKKIIGKNVVSGVIHHVHMSIVWIVIILVGIKINITRIKIIKL